MKVINETAVGVWYYLSKPNAAECGPINAHSESPNNPQYDNSQNVKVSVSGVPAPGPLAISIPDTGVGKTVTISLTFQ